MAETETRDDDDDQQQDVFFLINKVPIHFAEDWNTGIGGGLWSTGLAFAQYLKHRSEDVIVNLHRLASMKKCYSSDDSAKLNGISALELGSGNGFLSACLLALVASHGNNIPLTELVITDMRDHLPLIFKTLNTNSHVWDTITFEEGENVILDGRLSSTTVDKEIQHQRQTQQSPHVILAEHVWGKFESPNSNRNNHIYNKKYDFIFGTDLAYRNSLHDPLISSLLNFSHQHTLCLIGVTMTDTQPIFFARLTDAGFRYEKLADNLLQREYRGGNFGLIAIQRR
jgi:hypothetical protein